MLKLLLVPIRAIALCTSVGLAIAAVAPTALAQNRPNDEDEPIPYRDGICGLINYTGLRVIDGNRVARLEDFCQVEVPTAAATAAAAANPDENPFWLAFLVAASPTALQFAESAGRDDVIAYGDTICPYLDGGNTVADLRTMQSSSAIPYSFEAAVTVAAINTHCPRYRNQIGR